jgi:uncharacterized protein with ParB-like and HNH nuclease domain
MQEFESTLVSVEGLLGGMRYKIPLLQRKYVWQEEDVRDLLDDIQGSFEADQNSRYFIGGMVLSKNGGDRLLIIDGQQRMATIMLVFSAAVMRFEELNALDQLEFYEKIICKSFVDEKTGDVKQDFCLELHERDNEVFKKLLMNDEIIKQDLSVSERNLRLAKQTAFDFLNRVSDLKKYMAYLLKKVQVVKTVAADQSTAFQIFETLNDRGSRLEPEDLLKNLLLQKLDDNQYKSFEYKWESFIGNLMINGRYKVRVPTFLKHYIMSYGEYVLKNDIFEWFKKRTDTTTNSEVIDDLNDLEISSSKYIRLVDGQGNESIAAIKKLLFKQGNIVLMAGSHLGESDPDFVDICDLLEKIAFCYTITGSKTNELEMKFCDIAATIRKSITEPPQLNNAKIKLKEIYMDKKAITISSISDFKYRTQGDKRKVEYILRKMAAKLDGANYDNYTIEHILPETHNEGWIKLEEKEYNEYASMLGNLTLVAGSDNSSLKNRPFNDKVPIYAASPCRLTSSLAQKIVTGTKDTKYDKAIQAFNYNIVPTKWEQPEIIERQKAITRLAEFIWLT